MDQIDNLFFDLPRQDSNSEIDIEPEQEAIFNLGLKNCYSQDQLNLNMDTESQKESLMISQSTRTENTPNLELLGEKLNLMIGQYMEELKNTNLNNLSLQTSESLEETEEKKYIDWELNALREKIYRNIIEKINLSVIQSVSEISRSSNSRSRSLRQSHPLGESEITSGELSITRDHDKVLFLLRVLEIIIYMKITLKPEDETAEKTNSDRKKPTIIIASKVPTIRAIPKIKAETAEVPDNNKDAWKKMFGNFLHDVSLKKQIAEKEEVIDQHINEPLVREAPLIVPYKCKQFKLKFYRYLSGQITVKQLLKEINFPKFSKELAEQTEKVKHKGILNKIMNFRDSFKNGSPKSVLTPGHLIKQRQIEAIKQRRLTQAAIIAPKIQQPTPVQKKLQVLKEFVQERVCIYLFEIKFRKEVNLEQRGQDVRDIHFIKTFFDITAEYSKNVEKEMDSRQDVHFMRQIPGQRKLKQLLVNYENLKPVIKSNHHTESANMGSLRKTMYEDSNEYLYSLENGETAEYQAALIDIRRFLEHQNIRFQSDQKKTLQKEQSTEEYQQPQLQFMSIRDIITSPQKHKIHEQDKRNSYYVFTKQAQSDRIAKHSKGIVTQQDVRLYDYIHNKHIQRTRGNKQAVDKFNEIMNPKTEQEQDQQNIIQLNKRRLITNQNKRQIVNMARVKSDPTIVNNSGDESLQSSFEINLDSLYSQSNKLSRQLSEKNDKGFTRRLKQLMRMEDVSRACMKTNFNKLHKAT